MTDNTQELRDALRDLVQFHDNGSGIRYSYDRPEWETAANPLAVRALLAENDALRSLVAELAENDTYQTEYDGRMYSICHGCGAQDGESHRSANCVYLRAQAVLNPPAPPQGETA